MRATESRKFQLTCGGPQCRASYNENIERDLHVAKVPVYGAAQDDGCEIGIGLPWEACR